MAFPSHHPVALHLKIDFTDLNSSEEITLENLNQTNFNHELYYPIKIVASVETSETSYLENTIQQLVKHAILKHFVGNNQQINVEITENR